jgi:nitric oxide reductase NorD protein
VTRPPLTTTELEEALDELLWAALSSRRTAAPAARSLAALDRGAQDFVLHWVEVVEKTNAESAYQLASHAAEAFARLDQDGVRAWILLAMDLYDRAGVYAAVDVFQNVARFAEHALLREAGVVLEEVVRVLERFVQGLAGRRLGLQGDKETYTDTETLFLPEVVVRFPTRQENFQLYKATAVHLWAQNRFGTWRPHLPEALARYPDPERAARIFHALETLRLDACIAAELPGMHRDMEALRRSLGETLCPPGWEAYAARLVAPHATVEDTLALLARIYPGTDPLPPPLTIQGTVRPEQVAQAVARRLAREKQAFRVALTRMSEDLRAPAADTEEPPRPEEEPRFGVRRVLSETSPESYTFELTLDDRPVAPPENVRGLMESIIQDLGDLPPDYLVPAGEGPYYARRGDGKGDLAADVWKGTYHEEGAELYNEWDFRRQDYRKAWCVLRELEVTPQPGAFVQRTMTRYGHHLWGLRKAFEALRGDDRRLKKEPIGDEVDLDALVEAHADAATGLEMSDRLFTRLHKVERDIAVMFMVDMSGSTKGWVNDAERESLLLLCEALQSLGDRYAIYGFSGMTRKRCEVYRIKRFEDRYGDDVRARIAGITPRDYTRMGVAIRHLSSLLNRVEARTRLLVTLSDGKPDDYGGEYRGEYGIEDTRRALIEAKQAGIHPFCITIDREGQDYLPHMYGPVNYAVVDAVEKLPYKVSDIYRRLTR